MTTKQSIRSHLATIVFASVYHAEATACCCHGSMDGSVQIGKRIGMLSAFFIGYSSFYGYGGKKPLANYSSTNRSETRKCA